MNQAETMYAVRAHSAEPTDLRYEQVPTPSPGPGEVLVAVHATAVTAGELSWSDEWPLIPAHDLSGVVAELGAQVTNLAAGDEVYALIGFDRPGAAAEYVAVPADQLATKPASIDHVAAATVPLGALTAWQALVDHANVIAGQHVLVHGGAGGVGSYAVQLAAHLGAKVTATASRADADFVAGLGAHTALDYRSRFEDQVRDVDVVIDTVGGDTLARSWQVLRPGGILVGIADVPSAEDADRHGVRSVYFVVAPHREQLAEIARLVDAGAVRPMPGSVFPLAETATAVTTQRDRHIRGKVVIQVRPERAAAVG
jgi:NADPH:quinone reductase-like Zn-dependent oxidoreductase